MRQLGRPRPWLRRAAIGLPAVTVLVVALGVLFSSAPPALVAARVYAGAPPRNGQTSSAAFRIQVVSHERSAEHPVAVSGEISVVHDGGVVRVRFVTAEDGVAVFNQQLKPGDQPMLVTVRGDSGVLAEGAWISDRAESRSLGERSPRVEGVHFGASPTLPRAWITLLDGPLAVPFDSTLRLNIGAGEGARHEQSFRVVLEGVECLPAACADGFELRTDALGRADLRVRARLHLARLHLSELGRPGDGTGSSGWVFALPVVPGALTARLENGQVRVRSPIPRDVAYVNIIDAERTLLAARVPLSRAGAGSEGQFTLGALEPPLWAVTSSEHDLQSMATVGWPLGAPEGRAERRQVDAVIIDGVAQRLASAQQWSAWLRTGTLGFALLAMCAELGLLIGLRALKPRPRAAENLRGVRAEWSLLLVVGLGFLFLAVWALTRT